MQQAIDIVTKSFKDIEDILIVEINARDGSVTKKLAEIPGSTVHSFEPYASKVIPNLPSNVIMNYSAVMEKDGVTNMWIPMEGERYAYNRTTTYTEGMPPSVTYRKMIEVKTVSLESYLRGYGHTYIDLLWIDWYEAELGVVRNCLASVGSTSFMFVKWGNLTDMFGRSRIEPILNLIGDDWDVIAAWESDVLLANSRFLEKTTN